MKKNQFLFATAFFALFVIHSSYGEEVWKFAYENYPELLNGKTLTLPTGTVAMSEYVKVGNPSSMDIVSGSASIFFIIDNSGSMKNFNNGKPVTDRLGSRFTVTNTILDSIYKRNPSSEVGLAVFCEDLWFIPNNDPLFVRLTAPAGYRYGYIPLLTLNAVYPNFNNMTGIQLLKKYLTTQTIGTVPDSQYVDLATTNPNLSGSTNINGGFNAVKQAMKQSKYPTNRQYVIFFSDGEANATVGAEAQTAYVSGTNVPTTFTVYFTADTTTAFQNLKTMTDNIKNNNYSSSNPMSNLWSIKTDYNTLLKLLMEKVISQIIQVNVGFTPKTININTINPIDEWDSTAFTFGKMLPLTGKQTPFKYQITYHKVRDSILENGQSITVSDKDTTHIINFTVELQDNAPLPQYVKIYKWDRTMGFFDKNGAAITKATNLMNPLETRFSEKKVDILYGYKNISVVMTHSQDNPPDMEKFPFSQLNGYQSATFEHRFGAAQPGNGILEHGSNGNIVGIFRNPDLPLDTLRKTLATDSLLTPKLHDLKLYATIVDIKSVISLNTSITSMPEVKTMLSTLEPSQKTAAGYSGISLIIIQPSDTSIALSAKDGCSATLDLYDPVGNILFKNKTMAVQTFTNSANQKIFKRLIYVWDGKNSVGSVVGDGAYTVRANVKIYFDTTLMETLALQGMVGVRD